MRDLREWTVPPIAIHAVYAQTRSLPAKTRVLIDFLVERFGPEPYWDKSLRRKPRRSSAPGSEGIRVHPGRKALAMRGQRSRIEGDRHDLLLAAEFDQRLAEEVDHRAVAGIGDVVAVDADPVDADQ